MVTPEVAVWIPKHRLRPSHRRIHRKGLFGIPDDKPNMIVVVENEQKLRAVLPVVRRMIHEGLVVLLDAELIV